MKEKRDIGVAAADLVRILLNVLTVGYVVLIVLVMPFYYENGYYHIGTDKAFFFRTWTLRCGKAFLALWAVWLICRAVQKIRPAFSVTDLFAAGYALSVILSYLGTSYRDAAVWGATGWYMGTIPQLMLVGVYFAVSRFCRGGKYLLNLVLAVSAAVFALGILNRFGCYPLPMDKSEMPLFISTIGNINWYCGYFTAVFGVGAGLFWLAPKDRPLRTGLLALYLAVGFGTLVTQGSESGIFAAAVLFLTLFCLSVKDAAAVGAEQSNIQERFWQMVFLFSAACLLVCAARRIWPKRMDFTSVLGDLLTYSIMPVITATISLTALIVLRMDSDRKLAGVFRAAAWVCAVAAPVACMVVAGMIAWNTLRPGSLGRLSEIGFFTFSPVWGSNRGATWSAGARCFLEQDFWHKLTGAGPDCMWEYIRRDGSIELFTLVEDTFGKGSPLTNAHCEWLTVLVDTGILGFLSYGGMIVSAATRMIRRRAVCPEAAACGLCLLLYTANNLWSFQQSMSAATLFVLLGIGESLTR